MDRYANAPGHYSGNGNLCNIEHRFHAGFQRILERERPHILVPEIEAIATAALLEMERERLVEVIAEAQSRAKLAASRVRPVAG